MKLFKRIGAIALALAMTLSMAACGEKETEQETTDAATDAAVEDMKDITFVLDWTPNTNHTGLYVAIEKGYFKDAGLNVTVVQPPEDGAEVLVASGRAQFGVSFQDYIAPAITGSDPLGITAVAALVQHNTSGIISRKGEGMDHPAGLEGKKYATWDQPVEKATIKQVMEDENADFSKVQLIPSTVTDEVSALKSKSVDAIWIFYGWAGIACNVAELPTDYFAFKDINPVFDFYTPVVIGNNDFLAENPETARAFLAALAHGYEDCVEDPEEAADILMKAAPELKDSAELVVESQKYLSKEYIADAERWGEFDADRWSGFYKWLNDNDLLENKIDPAAGFTNDYLPEA